MFVQSTRSARRSMPAWLILATAACGADRISDTTSTARQPNVAASLGLPNGAAADTLAVGQTIQLTATLRSPGRKQRTVAWTSRAPELVRVSASGLAQALAPGSTTVVASNGAATDSALIIVRDTTPQPPQVGSVTVTPANVSVSVGSTSQLAVVVRDNAGNVMSGQPVTWASNNSAVAGVSSDGGITGVAAGSATVTASSGGKTGATAVSVTAPTSPPPPPPPAGETCSLVRDHQARAMPVVGKPAYLGSIIDPNYKTTITRIAGDPGTAIGSTGLTWGTISRHNYSKDPVWSADEKLLLLKRVSGAGCGVFLDGETYRPLFQRCPPAGAVETRWHPTLPDVMLYVTSSGAVGHWNVRTNTTTIVFAARPGYSAAYLGPWEGNFSRDGQWAAIVATRSSDGKQVVFAADLTSNTKYPDIDLAADGVTGLDWASISSTGKYVVVNGSISGGSDRTRVFTTAGTAVGTLWTEYGQPSHFDLSVDQSGNEVAVGVAQGGPYTGKVIARRLVDGVQKPLNSGGFVSHSSARNTSRVGWAYSSNDDTDGLSTWGPYHQEVFAVKLDGSLSIERLGNVHKTRTDYDGQIQAVPSPSGTRVVFASDWDGGATAPIQAYVIDTRPLCR